MNLPSEEQLLHVENLAEELKPLSPAEVAARLSQLVADGEPPSLLALLITWLELKPPAAPLPIGSKVGGRYTLQEEIGTGGMGSVWRARQDMIGRDVALKIIHPPLVTPDLTARFVGEIEMLGRLNHPGIVRIFDAGVHEQPGLPAIPFFTMELVDGVPLDRWADSRRENRVSLLRVMTAVCEAVQNAHESRIVHRDLKPSNILVRADGRPMVLDFGIARLTSTALGDESGMFSGTPQFAAPEQHLGRDHDFRSGESVDVYSTGVILFQIL
ncbi:MAG TPA: serine/threonine-protein kinase, partial [Verrucomicrobiae bacterium]